MRETRTSGSVGAPGALKARGYPTLALRARAPSGSERGFAARRRRSSSNSGPGSRRARGRLIIRHIVRRACRLPPFALTRVERAAVPDPPRVVPRTPPPRPATSADSSAHTRRQLDNKHAPRRNQSPAAPKPEHARNQDWEKTAAASAARSGEDLGRSTKRGGAKAARPSVDAAPDAPQARAPASRAGHHPSRPRASVVALGARVRGASAHDRARLGRPVSRHPLLDPAGPRAFHRRG